MHVVPDEQTNGQTVDSGGSYLCCAWHGLAKVPFEFRLTASQARQNFNFELPLPRGNCIKLHSRKRIPHTAQRILPIGCTH